MTPRTRDPVLVILVLSIAALAAAFTAQYGFGLRPCELCLLQRVPFAVAIVLSALALGLRLDGRGVRVVLALCFIAFAADAGLALYHVGVEQHWWAGPTSCTGGAGGARTIEDLAAMLSKPIDIPQCDKVAWSLFGISMAGYNVLAGLVLAAFSLASARRLAGMVR
jgi:disulfide bond formation protein DsbB